MLAPSFITKSLIVIRAFLRKTPFYIKKAAISTVNFLKEISWKIWLGLFVVLLAVAIWGTVKRVNHTNAIKERELLAEMALLRGQVELYEGLYYARATLSPIRLNTLHPDDSNLSNAINDKIETPIISTEIRTVFRDRIVYVSTPDEREDPNEVRVEIQYEDEDSPEVQNHIVDFDLTRQGFRIRGQTQSLGAQVQLELEQVDPFSLGIVITQQRQGGELNLFVEERSGLLNVEIGHFVYNPPPQPRRPLASRLGVGALAGMDSDSASLTPIASLDIGRTTLIAGPSFTHTDNSIKVGGTVGFTFRPSSSAR